MELVALLLFFGLGYGIAWVWQKIEDYFKGKK